MKNRHATKLMVWAFCIIAIYALTLNVVVPLTENEGADMVLQAIGLVIVLPTCSILFLLGFYRLLRGTPKN